MNYAEYEKFVVGLMSPLSTANGYSKMATAAFGLTAESGEFLDHVKKILFHGDDLSNHRQEMIKELGDIMFYVAFAASIYDVNLESLTHRKNSLEMQTQVNVFYHLLKLGAASGEYANLTLFSMLEHQDSRALLIEQMENIVFYVSFAANLVGSNLQEVIDGNVTKLSARYKDKKFTVEEFQAKEAAKNK